MGNGSRKSNQKRWGPFFFFFFFFFSFHFWKWRKFVLGLPKWEFSTGKKNWKNDFAPSEKYACYAPEDTWSGGGKSSAVTHYPHFVGLRITITHPTRIQCSQHARTRQWPGALKPKSYSLVEGNRSIVYIPSSRQWGQIELFIVKCS